MSRGFSTTVRLAPLPVDAASARGAARFSTDRFVKAAINQLGTHFDLPPDIALPECLGRGELIERSSMRRFVGLVTALACVCAYAVCAQSAGATSPSQWSWASQRVVSSTAGWRLVSTNGLYAAQFQRDGN
jgi:hypothetical protein